MATTVQKTIGTGGDYSGATANADWEAAAPSDLTLTRSSTAQSGSTSSTIVLDAGASAVDSFYNGHTVTCNSEEHLITAYVGATKTATIGVLNGGSATWSVTPSAGDAFTVNAVIWQGLVLNQEFTASANILTIGGETTSSTAYIEWKAQTGASFADNANAQTNNLAYNASNGAGLNVTGGYSHVMDATVNFTRISRMQIKGNTNYRQPLFISGTNFDVRTMILQDIASTAYAIDIAGAGPMTFVNVVAIAGKRGFSDRTTSTGNTYNNCTAVCPSDVTPGANPSAFFNNYGTSTYKNCAGFGFSSVFSAGAGTFSSSSSNNASDGTIGFGTANQASKTYANQFVGTASSGTLDFKIKNTSADLYNNGTTVSDPTVDIVGTSRPQGAAYDIGAWELVVGGGGGVPGNSTQFLMLLGLGT